MLIDCWKGVTRTERNTSVIVSKFFKVQRLILSDPKKEKKRKFSCAAGLSCPPLTYSWMALDGAGWRERDFAIGLAIDEDKRVNVKKEK